MPSVAPVTIAQEPNLCRSLPGLRKYLHIPRNAVKAARRHNNNPTTARLFHVDDIGLCRQRQVRAIRKPQRDLHYIRKKQQPLVRAATMSAKPSLCTDLPFWASHTLTGARRIVSQHLKRSVAR